MSLPNTPAVFSKARRGDAVVVNVPAGIGRNGPEFKQRRGRSAPLLQGLDGKRVFENLLARTSDAAACAP